MAIRLFMFSIGVGVGIGIGIEPCYVLRRVFMIGRPSRHARWLRDTHPVSRVRIPFNFLSIPIPIATPTPILLRQRRKSAARFTAYAGLALLGYLSAYKKEVMGEAPNDRYPRKQGINNKDRNSRETVFWEPTLVAPFHNVKASLLHHC
jgi:hypothetical protein